MTTRPPSATATPIRLTVPCAVVACSWTMDRPAAWAAAGTAFCGPARVVKETPAAVSWVPPRNGRCEAGESRMMTHATTANTATTPTRIMIAPR